MATIPTGIPVQEDAMPAETAWEGIPAAADLMVLTAGHMEDRTMVADLTMMA